MVNFHFGNAPGNNLQKTPFKNSLWFSHNLKIFEDKSCSKKDKTAEIPLESEVAFVLGMSTLGWYYHFSNPRNNLQKTHSRIPNVSRSLKMFEYLSSPAHNTAQIWIPATSFPWNGFSILAVIPKPVDILPWCLLLGLQQDSGKIKLDPWFHWDTLYSTRNTTFEKLTTSYRFSIVFCHLSEITCTQTW